MNIMLRVGREKELSIEDNDPIYLSYFNLKSTKIVILWDDRSKLCLPSPFTKGS